MTTSAIIRFAGSSNTANSTTGYRPLTQAQLLSETPQYQFTFSSIAVSGWATWPNLVNVADLAGGNVVIFDQSNDTSEDTAHVEAFIRRLWAQGSRVIAITFPAWAGGTPLTDDIVATPVNLAAINQELAVCTAYGVPVINAYQMFVDLVTAGTYHLNELMSDTAHLTALGHSLVSTALLALLPSGGKAQPSPLPDYVNADAADFEQTPVIKNGVEYDSRTGTWTDTGTRTESSEVGATITFSGTFRMYGNWRADFGVTDVEISVDGGAFAPTPFYANGADIGVRAAHTIIIKVASGTLRIDEFWAI